MVAVRDYVERVSDFARKKRLCCRGEYFPGLYIPEDAAHTQARTVRMERILSEFFDKERSEDRRPNWARYEARKQPAART